MAIRLGVIGGHHLGDAGLRSLDSRLGGKTTMVNIVPSSEAPEILRHEFNKVLGDADLVLVDLEPAWRTAAYRVAQECVRLQVPACFLQRSNDLVWLVPQDADVDRPCYLCFILRNLACRDDYIDVMFGDAGAEPAGVKGPVGLGPQAAELAQRFVTWIGGRNPVRPFWSEVLEIHIATGSERLHWFAKHPNCPVCRGHTVQDADGSAFYRVPPLDASALVSPVCGLIRQISEDQFGGAHLVTAHSSNPRLAVGGIRHEGLGCGTQPRGARLAAMGEAIEHYAAATWEPASTDACRPPAASRTILDAEQLLGSPAKIRTVNDGSREYLRVHSLRHETPRYMPIHMAGGRPLPAGWPPINLSSGVAAHTSRAASISHALAELVERDAFLMTWWATLPVEGYIAKSHPDSAIRAVLAAVTRMGMTIHLYRLPVAVAGHAFMSLALTDNWDPKTPRVAVGLGCHLDPLPFS